MAAINPQFSQHNFSSTRIWVIFQLVLLGSTESQQYHSSDLTNLWQIHVMNSPQRKLFNKNASILSVFPVLWNHNPFSNSSDMSWIWSLNISIQSEKFAFTKYKCLSSISVEIGLPGLIVELLEKSSSCGSTLRQPTVKLSYRPYTP